MFCMFAPCLLPLLCLHYHYCYYCWLNDSTYPSNWLHVTWPFAIVCHFKRFEDSSLVCMRTDISCWQCFSCCKPVLKTSVRSTPCCVSMPTGRTQCRSRRVFLLRQELQLCSCGGISGIPGQFWSLQLGWGVSSGAESTHSYSKVAWVPFH